VPCAGKAPLDGRLLLSDKGGDVAVRFGVRWTAPDFLREIHRQLGADLAQFDCEESWKLPMSARYVVRQSNVIAYAGINPDYTRRPEPSDILPILDKRRARHGA
jgi:hypothetical protein